jgi:hypothetical protein
MALDNKNVNSERRLALQKMVELGVALAVPVGFPEQQATADFGGREQRACICASPALKPEYLTAVGDDRSVK